MKKRLNILHLAAFKGNIGDNASHIGLRKILDIALEGEYSVTRNEIRDYYKNVSLYYRKSFDEQFVSYVNNFDLLIIGGGGFLDYFVQDSVTGTTLDISIDLLDTIRTPILFSSVGCDPNNFIPNGNEKKFKKFLDYIFQSDKMDILFRNDGSKENLESNFNVRPCDIKTILDNGFFFDTKTKIMDSFDDKYITMNVSFDQVHMSGPGSINIKPEIYYSEIRNIVRHIVYRHNINVCFIPHIFSDLKSINFILDGLEDSLIRKNIIIAPCIQGDYGANYNFSIYKNSEIVIGTRFHANVCGISMGVDTIGLSVLKRVEYMYNNIGIKDSFIRADNFFSHSVCKKIDRNFYNKGNGIVLHDFNFLKNESLKLHKNSINSLLNI